MSIIKSNKNKASITLILACMGFFVSSLFYDSFVGALFTAAFGSAMVGGMADWFAVNALFRKPLGIPYKTAILPRKRKKIFDDIVDMVQNTLLSKENIKVQLQRYSTPHLLLRFLEQSHGKEELILLICKTYKNEITQLNGKKLQQFSDILFKKNRFQEVIGPLCFQVINYVKQNGYDDKVLDFMIRKLQNVAAHSQVQIFILNMIVDAQRSYESHDQFRKIAKYLFEQLGYTPEKISLIIQSKLVVFLEQLERRDNPVRLQIMTKLMQLIDNVQTNPEWQMKLESWLVSFFSKTLSKQVLQMIRQPQNQEGMFNFVSKKLDQFVADFKTSREKQQKFDKFIKKILLDCIDHYHSQIGQIVLQSLNRYTDESLVEMIESKVGDDLQMIRINGTVVGGISGIILFLLTYWV